MTDVYLEDQSITAHYLGVIGYVLNGLVWPVHCRVYWRDISGQWFMTELADSPDNPNFVIIGKGGGYKIYVYKVPAPFGTKVGQADPEVVERAAREYANTRRGDLWYSGPQRKWHDKPQGYGGPMYDKCTSNTYAHWILSQAGLAFAKPKGAFGWESKAEFPGPVQ